MFEPREAVPPTNPTGSDYSEYDQVMEEIIDIYRYGITNNLDAILHKDFIFKGDPQEVIELSADTSWDRNEEKRITKKMLEDSSNALIVTFNSYDPISITQPEVKIQWEYHLIRKDSVEIEGVSYFTIKREQSRYYLTDWRDERSSSSANASWGRWKMENR
jgi:hypothetical protein